MLSVESRLRILGQFIDGASSSSDQLYGAGNNIFTRLAHPGKSVEFEGSLGYGKHISYWSPDAMKFVESYSFAGDTFGEKNQMSSSSPYDIKDTLKFTGQGNETMIPEGLSVFDFLEIMVFQKQSERQKQIDRMKKLGFETLRGIPIEERFVMRADLNKALAKVRAQWT
jgi:hypothetical protein